MSTTRKCIFGGVILASVLLYAVLEWHQVFKIVARIPIVGWLVEYNLPPSDFYCSLASVPLRLGRAKVSLVCKYEGRYELNIVGIDTNNLDYSGVRLHWKVDDASGRRLREKDGWGGFVLASGQNAKTAFRYCYDIFFVPFDLPSTTELTVTIVCSGAVDALLKQFPAARIEIKKCFDK